MLCLLGNHYQETAKQPMEFPVTREQLNHYRTMAENVQSELAATLVKFECAQSEVRHCTHPIAQRGVLSAFYRVQWVAGDQKQDDKQGISPMDKVWTYFLTCLAPPTPCWLLDFGEVCITWGHLRTMG